MTTRTIRELRTGSLADLEGFPLGSATAARMVPWDSTAIMSGNYLRLAPHCALPGSYHKVAEEFVVVTEGVLHARFDDEQRELHAGDFAYMPPGTRHYFSTTDRAAAFVCFQSPKVDMGHDVYLCDDATTEDEP